ncbi:MAG TPA: hypothetical protein VIE12_12340 [Actinomycetota bacterium]|jgi:hypothetical protein
MEHSCLFWSIECGTLVKGVGVTLAAFTLFIGSVYLLLTFVLGRWMGYLVLMVSFSGWMILFSALWLFGFWSQGLETPTNLGPRGSEPAWVVLDGGLSAADDRFETFAAYPGPPWAAPTEAQIASVQSVSGAAQSFLAAQANEELGLEEGDPNAVTGTQFTIDSIMFAPEGDTSLAVVQAHFSGGGPVVTLSLYHDSGSVPRYSYMFLAGSILLFLIHLPLLDRAEKKRKAFLTGGAAPAWYGPA